MSSELGEIEGNGKTEQQLKAEKIKAFTENPDNFLAISEIICCVVRNSKSQLGISAFVGKCKRSEINMAESELNHLISKTRLRMDMDSAMKQSQILTPNKPGFKGMFRRHK